MNDPQKDQAEEVRRRDAGAEKIQEGGMMEKKTIRDIPMSTHGYCDWSTDFNDLQQKELKEKGTTTECEWGCWHKDGEKCVGNNKTNIDSVCINFGDLETFLRDKLKELEFEEQNYNPYKSDSFESINAKIELLKELLGEDTDKKPSAEKRISLKDGPDFEPTRIERRG